MMRLERFRAAHEEVLAQLSTNGVRDWLADNLLTLGVLVVGLGVLFAASRQEVNKIVTTVVGLVFALAVLGLALIPNASENTAKFIAGLFTGNGG